MDSSKLEGLLASEYADGVEQRLVGTIHRRDSGYFDIVRFFGEGRLSSDEIRVGHLPEVFRVRDSRIADYASAIELRMRQEGRLYRGPLSMKLAAYRFSDPEPRIIVQPVDYGLQAATCFALDLHHETFAAHGGTLRDYWYATRRDRAIEGNPLAVCLGVCAYLLVGEPGRDFLLQVTRSGRLASFEATLGPSTAGVVDYHDDYTTLGQVVASALMTEAAEELNLRSEDVRLVPLAWGMEIFRGDRPQVFAMLETRLSRAEVTDRLSSLSGRNREHSAAEFVELTSGRCIPDSLLERANSEARMNLLLLEEYFDLGGSPAVGR